MFIFSIVKCDVMCWIVPSPILDLYFEVLTTDTSDCDYIWR